MIFITWSHGATKEITVSNEVSCKNSFLPWLISVVPVLLVNKQVPNLVDSVVARGHDLQHPVVVEVGPVSLKALTNTSVYHHALHLAGVSPGPGSINNIVDHHSLSPQLCRHYGAVLETIRITHLELESIVS